MSDTTPVPEAPRDGAAAAAGTPGPTLPQAPGPTSPPSPAPPPARTAELAGPRGAVLRVRDEIAKAVVGQDGAVSGLVAALLVRGHVLLEGVPGVAKTLLVKTLARTLDLDFKRVQFTPDLMPSDVTGQVILETGPGQGTSGFRFRQGPEGHDPAARDDRVEQRA